MVELIAESLHSDDWLNAYDFFDTLLIQDFKLLSSPEMFKIFQIFSFILLRNPERTVSKHLFWRYPGNRPCMT